MPAQTQIQTRRGTAASWTSTNPTLAAGEIGFESDTGKFKIGNGSTAWASLAYSAGATAVTYLFNATAAQTTFSGADANSLTLAYTVGAEQVYLNGALQVRGSDYTATNGTSIVLTSGALVNDVLNVIAYAAMTITDTYTQAQADAKFFQNANAFVAGKNKIINGDFGVWQRGTTALATATGLGNGFTSDRWQLYRSGFNANASGSRQATSDTTNLPNIQYCNRIQRTAASTGTQSIFLAQNFESINSIPLAGKTVTFSFYARAGANYSATSNILVASVLSGTGTDENMANLYTGQATVIGQNATLTTTWQRFTYSGSVASTATQIGLRFEFAPTGTAGANDYFEITGVQLEASTVASPFATNGGTYQAELAACQRYYWRSSVPSTSQSILAMGRAYNTTLMENTVSLPVPMRIYPTTLDFANISMTASGTTHTSGTWTLRNFGDTNQVYIEYVHGSGVFTAGQIWFLATQATLAGYIGLSAEL
jgi:hypothetical protein